MAIITSTWNANWKRGKSYHCLPNSEKQSVVAARDEFFQLVNSFNQQDNNQKPSSKTIAISNFIGDYDDAVVSYTAINRGFQTLSNEWPVQTGTLASTEKLSPISRRNIPPDPSLIVYIPGVTGWQAGSPVAKSITNLDREKPASTKFILIPDEKSNCCNCSRAPDVLV